MQYKFEVTDNEYFELFSNVLIIKGYSSSIIFDLQFEKSHQIPNSIDDFVKMCKKTSVKRLLDENTEYIPVLMEYLDFLLSNKLGFLSKNDDIRRNNKFNLYWNFPSIISNSIIELTSDNIEYYDNIIDSLNKLNCKSIILKIKKDIADDNVIEILNKLINTSICGVFLFIENNNIIKTEKFQKTLKNANNVLAIVLFEQKKFTERYDKELSCTIISSTKIMDNEICGFINLGNFSSSVPHFTEAQHFNTCLNRKLCIDGQGNIKNCSAMERNFGNIKDTSLENAINKSGFKDLWGIRKDNIDVCMDCEFRYMCTDCRCFINDPNDIYSQPSKCGYNPYIAKWKDDKEYVTVEQWRIENPNWEKKAKRKQFVSKPQLVD